jgi:23S rRNA U2552 (ribose-2'-O)-methylase RlmE/FtsJ
MNTLQKYFIDNDQNCIHKWMHYFDIYDRHFSRYRNTDVCILEIGVSHGGSLQMWKHYFGEKVKIFGVDINPDCKKLEDENIHIFIGDQSDRAFLRSVVEKIPRIDILIDDGGHTMEQQICTFEELFEYVDPYGIYLCEDLHTSYWGKYGGGYLQKGSFIEYSKDFIDEINAWFSRESELKVTDFTRSVSGVHFYTSVLVIEKAPQVKPKSRATGKATVKKFSIGK